MLKIDDFFTIKNVDYDKMIDGILMIRESNNLPILANTLEIDWDFILKEIPELSKLKDCMQSPKWHAEGDAFTHTKMVAEEMRQWCLKIFTKGMALYDFDKSYLSILRQSRIFIVSAILHDIGKSRTTKFGKGNTWHSYNHEVESEKIARRILWDEDMIARERVCFLVRMHMEPIRLMESNKTFYNKFAALVARARALKFNDIRPLIALKICDIRGSVMEDTQQRALELSWLDILYDMARDLHVDAICESPVDNIKKCVHSANLKSTKICVVMLGLPGAGKDTAISNFDYYVKDIGLLTYGIVSRDDIRAELGMCEPGGKIIGTIEEEDIVTEKFNERVRAFIKDKDVVIFNNMNNKRQYRDGYKALVKDYPTRWIYVYVEASTLTKNIERRKGQIPEHVFPNLIEKFEWPEPDEYDRLYCIGS